MPCELACGRDNVQLAIQQPVGNPQQRVVFATNAGAEDQFGCNFELMLHSGHTNVHEKNLCSLSETEASDQTIQNMLSEVSSSLTMAAQQPKM